MDNIVPEKKGSKDFKPITWKCKEYEHSEKSAEWFWALGLIGVAGAVASIMFNNVLFAIFILIAVFVLALYASRKPEEFTFTLTQRGLRIEDKLHPFNTFKAFGIEEFSEKHTPKLIFDTKKLFALDIVIPLVGVDLDEVHDLLLDFLPEDELEEPVVHKFMEWFGF
jgi:hypothetical protein